MRLAGVKSWTILPKAPRNTYASGCSLALNSEESLLATASEDGARIFEIASGKFVKALVAAGPVTMVAWSHDGKLLAIGERDCVSLWDHATGNLLRTIGVRPNYLAWSPRQSVLAVATSAKVSLFDDKGERYRPDFAAPSLKSMSWAPDGERLATADYSGMIEVRQTGTAELVAAWSAAEKPGPMSIAWSSSRDVLATAAVREPVRIWDPATGKLLRTLHDTGKPFDSRASLAWSPVRDELAVAPFEGGAISLQFYLRDAETLSHQSYLGSQQPAANVNWSPDGRLLIVQHLFGTVFVHDPAMPRNSFSIDRTWGATGAVLSEKGTSIAWMSKGTTSSDWGGPHVLALDLEREWRNGSFPDQEYLSSCLAFGGSAAEPLLAVAGSSLDLLRGSDLLSRTELPRPARCVASAPDGRQIALGLDREIALFDTARMQVDRTLPEYERPVCAVAWSQEGRLAAGYTDGSVRAWDAALSEFVTTTPDARDSGPVKRIAWSPDGRSIGVLTWGGHELAIIDPTDGRVMARVGGEEMVEMAWLDDATILARTPTCLKRWPLANLAAAEKVFEAPCNLGQALLSARGEIAADFDGSADYRLRDGRTGRPLGALVMLRDCRPMIVSPEGHYSSPHEVDGELIYVVETDDGQQQSFTPAKFAKRFRWKNDPNRALPLRFDIEHAAADTRK